MQVVLGRMSDLFHIVFLLDEYLECEIYVGFVRNKTGGLENAVHEAFTIGARAFGLFLRNQRQWLAKPLTDETVVNFSKAMKVNFC